MTLLEVTRSRDGFKLRGELDLATADTLTASIVQPNGAGPIVLDFSELTFMDSSGLRVLLEVVRSCAPMSKVVIVNPPPQVQRVLDISLPDGVPGLEVRT
jgi:anti-anti-sigma factor